MTGDWLQTTWGDVVTLQRGFDITKAQQVLEGDVPVVSSGGISSFHNVAAQEGPGVVMGRKGTLGRVFYLDGPYWPHDTTLWVKDFKGNLPRFVYYALLGIDTKSFDVGSSNPTLNRNHVHPLPVHWPSTLAEQERIAGVLGAFDDLIDTNRRLANQLSNLATYVYMAETGSSPRVPLSELLRLAYGKALPAKKRVRGPVPVVSSAGVTGSHNQALVPGPGVVVGRKGTVGSVTWVRDDFFPIDTAFYAISDLPAEIVLETLSEANLTTLNSDSAVPGLNRDRALAQPVADVRGRPARRLAPLLSAFRYTGDQLLAEAAELSRQRDELLPLLMSGRVRVRDLEAVA